MDVTQAMPFISPIGVGFRASYPYKKSFSKAFTETLSENDSFNQKKL